MIRSIVLLLLLLLLPLAVTTLAQDEDVAGAEAAVEKAREQVEFLKSEVAGLYKEIEHDFEFLRSPKWAALSAPYHDAVALQSAALTTEPDTDPLPALQEAFRKAGLLSTVVTERLAAAAAQALMAPEEPPEAETALAEAIRAVFPVESFPACWEAAFLDLPVVLLWKEANDELAAAERKLEKVKAESGERPAVPHGMVLVPRGRFVYGPWEEGWKNDLKANKESKERVDGFFIDVHEVTNEDYAEFLAGIENLERREKLLGFGMTLAEDGAVRVPDGQELFPVRGVTLEAAAAYAESVGKRLPTEEEWEKAARGAKGLRWPWGADFDEEACNFEGAGRGGPAAVGSFEKDKSPYGVMDMAGNVSELTSTLDERRPYKEGKLTATDSVIYRGGNYEDGESSTTATFRWLMSALSGQSEKVGFRCVISEKAWKRRSR